MRLVGAAVLAAAVAGVAGLGPEKAEAKGGYYELVIGGGDLLPYYHVAQSNWETMPCGWFAEGCPEEVPAMTTVERPANADELLAKSYEVYFTIKQMGENLPARYIPPSEDSPGLLYFPPNLELPEFPGRADSWVQVPQASADALAERIETAISQPDDLRLHSDPIAALVYTGESFAQVNGLSTAGRVLEVGVLRDGKTVWIGPEEAGPPLDGNVTVRVILPGSLSRAVVISPGEREEMLQAYVATLHNWRQDVCPNCVATRLGAQDVIGDEVLRGECAANCVSIRYGGTPLLDYLPATELHPPLVSAHLWVPLQGGFGYFEADPSLTDFVHTIVAKAESVESLNTPAPLTGSGGYTSTYTLEVDSPSPDDDGWIVFAGLAGAGFVALMAGVTLSRRN